jgi:DNA polymerase-3 subunit epsilon
MQMELFYPNVFSCFAGPGYNIPQPLPYIEKKEQFIGLNKPILENVSPNTIDASHCLLPPVSSVNPVATSSPETKKRKYTKKDKPYCDISSQPSPVVFKKHYRNVLVFDTETTGLLPKVTPENIHSAEMPRIIQLSYILFDTCSYDVKKIGNHYIKLEDGIEIPPLITEITGIHPETCKTRGVDITDALIDFYNTAMEADCIVGHNVAFDIRMLECEIERNYFKLEPVVPLIISLFNPMYMRVKNMDVICTMKESIHICNIIKVDKNGRSYKKFPKLCEVYLHLFKNVPEHLHNAMIDVVACLRCFLKVYMNKDMHDVKYNKIISNATQMEFDK